MRSRKKIPCKFCGQKPVVNDCFFCENNQIELECDEQVSCVMYYVYSRHVGSGRENYISCYSTMKEAVSKIRMFYNIDAEHCAKDEYYYFVRKH